MKRTCRTSNVVEDHISCLPDEILISVLSRLDDIEQQARTSVIARRWRHLWCYAVRSLRFSLGFEYILYPHDKDRPFVNRVNSTLLSLSLGNDLDEFSVESTLDVQRYETDFDGWLRFAFEKRVKKLNFFPCVPTPSNHYSLTAQAISNNRVDYLISLCLASVGVTGDVLERLLSICPLLEELSVSYSQDLINFTVSGSSLKLKHLEIHGCWSMKSLFIHDVNLVSLKYSSDANNIIIKNTPHLVTVGFRVTTAVVKMITRILSQLPLLKTLEIVFRDYRDSQLPSLPPLRNLRKLKVVITRTIFSSSCKLCANLLVAAPFLSELQIEFRHCGDSSCKEEEVRKLENPHGCLKVVELRGFKGCGLDLGVAFYLIENTQSLEKMIIDTDQIFDPRHPYKCEIVTLEMQQSARALAKEKLEKRLHPSAHFVVK